MNFEREIQELQHRVKKLEYPKGFPMYEAPKPLVFSEDLNTPCTAELEVKLHKLAAYFEKRAKENSKRAEKEEKKAKVVGYSSLGFPTLTREKQQHEHSDYYFSGKAYTYTRAAQKIREVLGEEETMPEEIWIIEYDMGTYWERSLHFPSEYPSKEDAKKDISLFPKLNYRATRVF